MKLSKFFIVPLWFWLSHASLAQENFIPGFIVLADGDTLSGLIDDQQWSRSPNEFTFKNAGGIIVTYSYSQVNYFYLEDSKELYQSISTSFTTRPPKNNPGAAPEKRNFTGFITVLVIGEMSLYKMNYLDMEYFFIKRKNEPLEELTEKTIIANRTAGASATSEKFMRRFPVYRSTLKSKMADCQAVQNKIESLQFKSNDFINLVSEYNTCVSNGNTYSLPKIKSFIPQYGFIGGSYKGSLTVQELGASAQRKPGEIVMNKVGPAVGAFLTAYHHRLQKRYAIYTEILFKPFKAENTETYSGFIPRTVRSTYQLNYLKLSGAFRYTMSGKAVRPFFQAGYGTSIPVAAEVRSEIDVESPSSLDETKYYAVPIEKGILFGGGFNVKRIECEFRYESTAASSDFGLKKDKGENYYVLLKYSFGKN